MTGFLTCAVRPHLPGMAASGNIAADIKAFTAAGTVPDYNIVVVCIEEWIKELEGLLIRFGITKVVKVIPGGETGHDSIYYGLMAMKGTADRKSVV